MDQQHKSEFLEEYIRTWAQVSDHNPHIVLSDWLHVFSVQMGLAMRLADINEEHLEDALLRIDRMVRAAYYNSKGHIAPASLQ